MIRQLIKFYINGGILGVISWALQLLIYMILGGSTPLQYLIASALTYIPLIVVNFIIQRSMIFNKPGQFSRFIVGNLFVMSLTSLLAPVFRYGIDSLIGIPWGDRAGFLIASLFVSMPSFLIAKYWAFKS